MSTKATKLDLSIPPDAHPACVGDGQDFRIGESDGEPVLHASFTVARSAVDSAFRSALALSEAEKSIAIAGDDPAASRRLRAGAAKLLGAARQQYDGAINALAQHRAKLADEIDAQIGIPAARTSVCDSTRAACVRSAVRNMPQNDRFAALELAATSGDGEAVAAVLSACPLASGLDRKSFDMLKLLAEQRFAPAQFATRSAIDTLRDKLERAAGAIDRRFGHLIGEGDDTEARKQAALMVLEGGAA